MPAKIVEVPEMMNPHQCAVTADIDGPFIDTGKDLIDPVNASQRYRIYLHTALVKEYARELGMVDREELEAVSARLAELDEKYSDLNEYRKAAERLAELEPVVA